MELTDVPRPPITPPPSGLRAVVVVPARDEEERIYASLEALATQRGIEPGEYEVIVVLDACVDATAARVRAAGERWPRMRLWAVPGPGRGAGAARALGMEIGCARLESVGAQRGLLASTDADSRVASDWLTRQLSALESGAEAVGGDIALDPGEAASLPPLLLERRRVELARRTAEAGALGPAEHAHFAGASLGVTPSAYRRAGGMDAAPALEDQGFEDRLASGGIPIHRLSSVRVTTSARTDGRAERGLGVDLELGRWLAERRFHGAEFEIEGLLRAKRSPIAAIVPTRECAATIGPTVAALAPLRRAGLIDELLVVDADSADGTARIAAGEGAEVVAESSLRTELGPCLGKGDAMWRAAATVEAETLVFLDGDSGDFRPEFLTGLLGPLLTEPRVELVKGNFERPFAAEGTVRKGEGGRVTELVARPLLNLHFPRLAGFGQPLAGEIAIRRGLLGRMRVPVGYGVEIAMLIDACALVGLGAMAEVDLGVRQNRHQPLRALGTMAGEVMMAVERRLGAPERPDSPSFLSPSATDSRPLLRSLRGAERPPFSG